MKAKRILFLITAAIICLSTANLPAFAQNAGQLRVDFKDTRLKNGLRVITVEDRSAPVVSLSVTYNVGSRDEQKGRTGFAHFFEHMMFQGSENVGKSEHFSLVENVGGIINGTTNADRTNYFQAVPSNQLEMILFLEADRMRGLEITQENVDNQRNAVKEERRQRVDNVAYGKSDEMLDELMYDNFAYKHSIIGSMEDLSAARVEDFAGFFKTYYVPNNAVLTLVGDFDTTAAMRMIRKYFENIPRGANLPPAPDMTEPKQTAERRATVEDPLARATRVRIAFKSVPGNTPDFYALQVLATTLTSGQSSRLFQKLVREKELVTNISGAISERRGVGAFNLTATMRPGKNAADVEAVIYEEINRLQNESIADWELQKSKSNSRRNFVFGLQDSLSRAINIGTYAVYYNDPNLINTRLDRVNAVSADDVRRVAREYLQPTNRSVIVTVPKAGAPAKPTGAATLTPIRQNEKEVK
ncbi:MAG TPA: pitrilysin family protein [Pyrinomonadaceae bacterium]|nr:pitrilysin family protein [Pyrinomonadaceae bacterium]